MNPETRILLLAAIDQMDKWGDVPDEMLLRAVIWLAQISDQHATITRDVNWDRKSHGKPPKVTLGHSFNPFLNLGKDEVDDIPDLQEHFERLAKNAFGIDPELVQI